MNSKIEGPSIHLRAITADPVAAGTKHGHSKVAATQPADTLRLTGHAVQLQSLSQQVTASPEVDLKRVAAVREALASGQYRIDPANIADRLMSLEHALKPRG